MRASGRRRCSRRKAITPISRSPTPVLAQHPGQTSPVAASPRTDSPDSVVHQMPSRSLALLADPGPRAATSQPPTSAFPHRGHAASACTTCSVGVARSRAKFCRRCFLRARLGRAGFQSQPVSSPGITMRLHLPKSLFQLLNPVFETRATVSRSAPITRCCCLINASSSPRLASSNLTITRVCFQSELRPAGTHAFPYQSTHHESEQLPPIVSLRLEPSLGRPFCRAGYYPAAIAVCITRCGFSFEWFGPLLIVTALLMRLGSWVYQARQAGPCVVALRPKPDRKTWLLHVPLAIVGLPIIALALVAGSPLLWSFLSPRTSRS